MDGPPPPSPQAPAVDRHSVLRQLGVVLLGVLGGLAAADVAVGLYDADRDLTDTGLLIPDEVLSWTNRPGFENAFTRISSLGLRSPEIPADAPPDELRILGVGASRTYGAGEGAHMDETWSRYWEDFANERLEGSWRVLNGGVMGYSMRQSARRAARLLDAVDPDLVVLFCSPGRQLLLDPSSARHVVLLESGRGLPRDLAEVVPGPLLEPVALLHELLLDHSALYARYRTQFSDEGEVPEEVRRYVLTRANRPALIEEMFRETLDELAHLAELCAERGIVLRAAVMPEPFQDSERRWTRFLRKNAAVGAPPLGTPREEGVELLREELAAIGIESWSLVDAVTQVGTDLPRYTVDREHWSGAGHRLVARGLQRALVTESLAPTLLESRAARPR